MLLIKNPSLRKTEYVCKIPQLKSHQSEVVTSAAEQRPNPVGLLCPVSLPNTLNKEISNGEI
jgi:hypothetical protein